MDTNRWDINNHLDADSLLPPRKRLLAGLKRNNSDVKCPTHSTPNGTVDESNAQSDSSMKALLNNPHSSYEEIIKASRITAKIAVAARANAEEKAAKAARAVTAAKNALELVSAITEKVSLAEKYDRRSKSKNVQALRSRNKGWANANSNGTDEELARKLHQAINSSPRILKNSPVTDTKNHKHKKVKGFALYGKAVIDCNVEKDQPSAATKLEGSINKPGMVMMDALKPCEDHQLSDEKHRASEGHSEREVLDLKGKHGESLDSFAKKRGRPKLKKLPLSIFSSKEEGRDRNYVEDTVNSRLTPVERSSSMWICQSLNASADVKLNKIAQS